MNVPFVDLSKQHRSIQVEMNQAMLEVIQRGDFILGSAVRNFEEAFARFVGTKHCIGVASGTDALTLALRCAGIGSGDKVLVPANTFIATALAVSYTGGIPVLVDVDPHTYTLDRDQLRHRLPAGLKAILPVHLYGQPADMEAITEFAREKGLLLIEDAAQAHGAKHRRGGCGTFGLAAGFSFYPAKNLGALGDGGAITTNDDSLAEQLRLARNWGSTVKYHHQIQGYNSRLDTLQAAVLGIKLQRLAAWNQCRRQVAQWYRELLASLSDEIVLPTEAEWTTEHVYHLFVVQLKRASRESVMQCMKAAGIDTGIHYPIPIHLQPAYRALGLGEGAFPITEDLSRRIVSLPMYAEMSREQVQAVATALAIAVAER